MSAFRDFEQAKERFEAAKKAYEQAQTRIQPFAQKGAEELEHVLAKFAEANLFEGMDTYSHKSNILKPKSGFTINDIEFRGHWREDTTIADDHQGDRMVEEIVDAARAQNIPVYHNKNGSHHLHISIHVKEPEKGPEILLNALGAYAEKKGNGAMAQAAREAASRLKTLVSTYTQIE